MEYKHYKGHNVQAIFNDTNNSGDFTKILRWLRTTNLIYALTTPCEPNENHIREFWKSAVFVATDDGTEEIHSNIHDERIVVSEAVIREVLQLEDDVVSISYSMRRLREIFIHGLAYQPQAPPIKEFEKTRLHNEYRYVIHLVMNCLSPRKGGQSKVSREYANAVVAIIYRLPLNFSRMIFTGMKNNIITKKEKEKFLLYPRFLQMIINHLLPNIRRTGKILTQTSPNVFARIKKRTEKAVYVIPENYELVPWIENPNNAVQEPPQSPNNSDDDGHHDEGVDVDNRGDEGDDNGGANETVAAADIENDDVNFKENLTLCPEVLQQNVNNGEAQYVIIEPRPVASPADAVTSTEPDETEEQRNSSESKDVLNSKTVEEVAADAIIFLNKANSSGHYEERDVTNVYNVETNNVNDNDNDDDAAEGVHETLTKGFENIVHIDSPSMTTPEVCEEVETPEQQQVRHLEEKILKLRAQLVAAQKQIEDMKAVVTEAPNKGEISQTSETTAGKDTPKPKENFIDAVARKRREDTEAKHAAALVEKQKGPALPNYKHLEQLEQVKRERKAKEVALIKAKIEEHRKQEKAVKPGCENIETYVPDPWFVLQVDVVDLTDPEGDAEDEEHKNQEKDVKPETENIETYVPDPCFVFQVDNKRKPPTLGPNNETPKRRKVEAISAKSSESKKQIARKTGGIRKTKKIATLYHVESNDGTRTSPTHGKKNTKFEEQAMTDDEATGRSRMKTKQSGNEMRETENKIRKVEVSESTTKTIKCTPLPNRIPDGTLDTLDSWVYEGETNTAVLHLQTHQYRLHHPRELQRLGEHDIRTLSCFEILNAEPLFKDAAKRYTRMIGTIIKKKLWT